MTPNIGLNNNLFQNNFSFGNNGMNFNMGGFNPAFNGGMNFSNIWGNTSFAGSSSSSSSSSGSKEMSLTEKLKFQEEHKAEIEQAKKQVEEYEKLYAEAKKAEAAEDGTLQIKETKEDFAKIPWYKKLGRAVPKAVGGFLTCGFKALGIEFEMTPPFIKINPKQLGIAAAGAIVTAGLACLTPYAIPVLLTAGLLMGGGKAIHGLGVALTTDDPEKFDNACEGIGEGAMIAVASAGGIKAMNPGATSSWKVFSNIKGMFNNQKVLLAAEKAANPSYWGRVAGRFNKNYVQPVKDFKSVPNAQQKFQNELNTNVQNLDAKITDVNTRLASASSEAERALLNQEKLMLQAQKDQITLTTTRQKWNQVAKENHTQSSLKEFAKYQKQMENGNKIQVGTRADGTAIEMDANSHNLEFLKQLQERNLKTVGDIKKLAQTRKSTMRRLMLSPKDGNAQSALNQYTGGNTFLGRAWGLIKPNRPQWGWNKKALWDNTCFYIGGPLKIAKNYFFHTMMKPYNWYKQLTKAGYTTPYTVERTFFPKYDAPFFGNLLTMVGCNENNWYGGSTPMMITTLDQNQQPVQRAATKEDIESYYAQNVKDAKKIYDDFRNGIVPATTATTQQAAAQLTQTDAASQQALEQALVQEAAKKQVA